jgi:predicted Zn-dependent protease with MMP-like domain
MDMHEFEQLVADIGFSPVPERFREHIANVALIVEDDVLEETRRDMELPDDETLLGLYHGVPHTARGESYGIGGALPDTITLYRLPIIDAAREDGLSVRQVIEETIWHEVAHHFGLDEEAVERRERERGVI